MDNLALFAGFGGGAAVASVAYFASRRSYGKRLEAEQNEKALFKELFNHTEELVAVLDEERIYYVNKAFYTYLDVPEKSILKAEALPEIQVKKDRYRLDTFVAKEIRYQEKQGNAAVIPQARMFLQGKRDGTPVTIYAKKIEGFGEHRRPCYAVVLRDISHQEAQSCLMHLHHLTELPNEIQAKKDLNKIFSRIHLNNDKKLALLMIEIDKFSQIRAMIGHEQAEKQLIHIARYLKREAETVGGHVYHMFMNVFMVVLPKVDRKEEVASFCKKIERQLENFYEIDNIKLHLSASIGIAMYPDAGSTFMLIDNAYKALQEAQNVGYGQYRFFSDLEVRKNFDELELYNNLHTAIDNKEFEVYYQPIVRAKDLEVVAAEALIRWKHPKYGYVPPSLFVPMLEKSGYVIELGRYVLETVAKQIKRWEMFRFRPVQISINMSMLELESSGFVDNVAFQLKDHQVEPELIKFEVTEGIAMQNEELMQERLEALKKIGVSIALDDFGTGYTSFAYLKKVPADLVKIDRSMVTQILESEEDERIVHAMIELGHNLNMKVVVEGVEDEWMMRKLRELGCDYMQGFYFSKPLPAYEFQELIRINRNSR